MFSEDSYLLENDDFFSSSSLTDSLSDIGSIFEFSEDELLLDAPKRKRKNGEDSQQIMLKRNRYPQYVPVPKILRRDIRRSYAEMFMNVINANDITMTEGFLTQYSIPSLSYSHGSKQHHKTLNSRSMVLQLLFNRIQAPPDTVARFSEAQVHTFSNTNESKITCQIHIKKTKLYNIRKDWFVPSDDLVEQWSTLAGETDSTSISSTIGSVSGDSNVSSSSKHVQDTKRKVSTKSNSNNNINNNSNGNISGAGSCISTSSALGSQMRYDTTIVDVISQSPLYPEPVVMEGTAIMTMYLNGSKEIIGLSFEQMNSGC